MTYLRIRDAAELLGVSDDTVRRWIDTAALPVGKDASGRKTVDGGALAQYAREHAIRVPQTSMPVQSSARNRFPGLVTKVVSDSVMAHVEMQCGPFTVASLMSATAVRELGLEPGTVAVASVKATMVTVEIEGSSAENPLA
ncbi:helix-turn-helix domain-containing protein [Skermania sp. ID1734]|uniref:TOBE domain-containing protein n=1 Tax=Skermania sp. ID1734 TaxID=2597516 RepID=UPI00117D3E0B|nr:TOBE domain-containing protein [Skermania sp. ID1734]TSD99274.1 helix-turn-helix domain-containing protein [Skermania sp. ID1734]